MSSKSGNDLPNRCKNRLLLCCHDVSLAKALVIPDSKSALRLRKVLQSPSERSQFQSSVCSWRKVASP
eukprot:CAMPEP_0195648406 /NCGR_PEP_ID=MMETSP0815-20121206/30627_1 /TAXON_ID=97485 /ORGANISM="Prymnesium parvum, Strain Texoma1" /LENGTH=67 /DNA_ID=CAMNT_0040792063 /DNA_START=237 /DNA_END=437 /DNA_ORIENTATION=-